MPTKPTPRELALTLSLTVPQIRELIKIGAVEITTRRKTIDAIKAVRLTLRQASEVWGFSVRGGMLLKYVVDKRPDKRLPLANSGESYYGRWNPRLVTVAAMLDLMDKINRPASGFGVDGV